MRLLLLTIFLFLVSMTLHAQKIKSNGLDSLYVRGRSHLMLPDTAMYIKNDTVLLLPAEIVARIRKDREAQTTEFYKNLKKKFSRHRLTRELYDLLFDDSPSRTQSAPVNETNPNVRFDEYEGRRISKIIIKKLDPFGTRVTDTTRAPKDWFSKAGNSVHVTTRYRVIRNNLFFEEGDFVEPNLMKDTERILRTLPFMRDARIYILEKQESLDVDVLVVTKDVWNLSVGASYDGLDEFNLTLSDKNFMGLGYELENEFPYNNTLSPKVGYVGRYTATNIYKTFITGELSFARSAIFDREGVRVSRNFITQEIKYAGGGELSNERRTLNRVFADTTIVFDRTVLFQDYWFGRSIKLKEKGTDRTNLQMAVGYERSRFTQRPEVTIDTNRAFTDNSKKLFTIGVSKRHFERSSLVLGYGRTEDIPIGILGEVTIGREHNEFYSRNYIGTEFSIANFWGKNGYFRPSVKTGTYIYKGNPEQGIFSVSLDFFSLLYRIRRTNLRQFFTVEFSRGYNRFDNEFINISDENGVRGLSNVFLRGTKKFKLNAETVAFTPIYLIGFRMAIYGFADLAWINNDRNELFSNTLYQGYGLGIRFRNENLAFNTFELRLGYYPVTPPDVEAYGYEFMGAPRLGLEDLRVNRPQVLQFR